MSGWPTDNTIKTVTYVYIVQFYDKYSNEWCNVDCLYYNEADARQEIRNREAYRFNPSLPTYRILRTEIKGWEVIQ